MKERLLKLITWLGATATRFADDIGVQRSGISHILSGRNQPSYDFLVKIMTKYPEINPDWLILGKGEMLRSLSAAKTTLQTDLFTPVKEKLTEKPAQEPQMPPSEELGTTKEQHPVKTEKVTNVTSISRIVFFYSDGKFQTYVQADE